MTTTTTTVSASGQAGVNVSWTYTNGMTTVTMRVDNLQTSHWLAVGLSLDDNMVKMQGNLLVTNELFL